MSTLSDLKDRIIAKIYQNTQQKVTGQKMQDALLDMIDTMGVSVLQNTSTGHTDITIGDEVTPLANIKDVGYSLTLNDARIYMHNPYTGEYREGYGTGYTRIRILFNVFEGFSLRAFSELGTIVAATYDNDNDAIRATANVVQQIESTYTSVLSADISDDSILTISIRKEDNSEFTEEEYNEYIASLQFIIGYYGLRQYANDIERKVGHTLTKFDALAIRRVYTSSSSEDFNGTRIRVVFYVKAGTFIKAQCPNYGTSGGIYNTLNNAVVASDAGKLEVVRDGYGTELIEHIVQNEGYLQMSLKKADDSSISDADKDLLLSDLSIYIDDGEMQDLSEQIQSLQEQIQEPKEFGNLTFVGQGMTGVIKYFNLKTGRIYEITPVTSWEHPSAMSDSQNAFTIGERYNEVNTDIFQVKKNQTPKNSYIIKAEEDKSYYVFLRANVGVPVNVTISDITGKSNAKLLYTGKRIEVSKKSCLSYLHSTLADYGAASMNIRSQAMDIYEDRYMFISSSDTTGDAILVVDMVEKTVSTIYYGSDNHMNNLNIGAKYSPDDKFPLLYLSEHGTGMKCKVLRLSDDASSFTVVQSISYIGTHYNNHAYDHDWIIDIEKSMLYAYGLYDNTNTKIEFLKFTLPNIANADVELSDTDIQNSFIISDVNTYQGAKVINGNIFMPFGYGNVSSPAFLYVVEPTEGEIISTVPLGVGVEYEGVAPFDDGILLVNWSGNTNYIPYFYKMTF